VKRQTIQHQLSRFKSLLKSVKPEQLSLDSAVFLRAQQWLLDFPTELTQKDKEGLRDQICDTFNLSPEELLKYVSPTTQPFSSLPSQKSGPDPTDIELDLWDRIPRNGFFHKYCEYTSQAEGPLAFHLFSALCAVGCIIGRHVWIDMGYYKVYPNLSVVLLARTGICRKTTTTDIAVYLLQKLGIVKVYADKMTPESLVDDMQDSASGLIYAPDLPVFLGTKDYDKGMVPLLTRLLDNPDSWRVKLKGKGSVELTDVALSMLAAATPEEFINDIPKNILGGGLFNRFLLLAQDDTPREEAIPQRPSEEDSKTIINQLAGFKEYRGEMSLSPSAESFWRGWYHEHKQLAKTAESDTLSNYVQRRPDRVLKVAMPIHLDLHKTMSICESCLRRSLDLLIWTEQFMPATLKGMLQTQEGEEQQFVLNMIEKCGGLVDWSVLVRRCQYKMNAARLKMIVRSLSEGRQIKEVHDATAHYVSFLERRE
jgi:hypothetical protein